MNETEQLLAQLRDIHEPAVPESVSLWLIIANVALLILIVSVLIRRRQRTREQWRKEALQHIESAQDQAYESGVLSLAKLLRQLMRYRGHDIRSDRQTWLAELDAAFETDWFSKGQGQVFGDALYQARTSSSVPLPVLCKHLERLVKSLPARVEKHSQTPAATQPQAQ